MSVLSLCLVLVYILYIKINGSVKEKKNKKSSVWCMSCFECDVRKILAGRHQGIICFIHS